MAETRPMTATTDSATVEEAPTGSSDTSPPKTSTEGAPATGTGGRASGGWEGWVTGGATLAFAAFVILKASLENSALSRTAQMWIWVGVVVTLVVAILAGLAYAYRKLPQVAGATNLTVLVLVVVLSSLVPVLFLNEAERILALKLAAILFLSLLPGWLYIQFVAVKGKTLWDEYVLNLYRLQADDHGLLPEPPRDSVFHRHWEAARDRSSPLTGTGSGWRNVYELKFRGLYGHTPTDSAGTGAGEARLQGENLLPVVVHTVLLAVCWTMVLRPSVVFGIPLLSGENGFSATQLGELLPDLPLRFAFAGAYFFLLQMLVRRYFQDDLKTGAYINATVRVIITGLLVCTLHVVWPEDWTGKVATAFLIGVFPQLGLQVLRSLIALPLRRLVPTLRKRYPLSALDGMNIWYESRLLEEGIEDMQNLATANVVDVMLRTRIPVDRLIDWIDQAHLDLHLWPEEDEKDNLIWEWKIRKELRRHGIRTATDLENIFQPGAPDDILEPYRWLLNPKDSPPSITETLVKVLADEPNLHFVRSWKRGLQFQERSIPVDPR